MTPDANTVEINLPTTIPAYVVSNADTSYTIVLNAGVSWERRFEAYTHELRHMEPGDYERNSARLIEFYSHGLK